VSVCVCSSWQSSGFLQKELHRNDKVGDRGRNHDSPTNQDGRDKKEHRFGIPLVVSALFRFPSSDGGQYFIGVSQSSDVHVLNGSRVVVVKFKKFLMLSNVRFTLRTNGRYIAVHHVTLLCCILLSLYTVPFGFQTQRHVFFLIVYYFCVCVCVCFV